MIGTEKLPDTPRTKLVKSHVRRVTKMLGAPTTADATAYFLAAVNRGLRLAKAPELSTAERDAILG
jgi:hypothetical protein